MAFWRRKGKKQQVQVFYRQGGVQKAIPRWRIKEAGLDTASDLVIENWVRDLGIEGSPVKLRAIELPKDLKDLLDQFINTHMTRFMNRTDMTTKMHNSYLVRYVLPFFIQQGYSDPQEWYKVSVRMAEFLRDNNVSPVVSNRCNISLRLFYNFIREEGKAFVKDLPLRKISEPVRRDSIIGRKLHPQEVIHYAENQIGWLKIAALCGYFFSLRPQELFALKKKDFRAGLSVEGLTCVSNMRKVGLFDKLVVDVQNMRRPSNVISPNPVNKGIGWVNCFEEQAGRMIVDYINQLDDEDLLIPVTVVKAYTVWKAKGIEGITLKDLRRASLFHLGFHTELDQLALQKHARHKDFKTTSKYLRESYDSIDRSEGPLNIGV